MSTSFIPSIGDLLQALHFGVVVGLICGLGFLTGTRRPEIALFTGWGLGCLVSVILGGLFGMDLGLVMYGLGLLGLIGLSRWIIYGRQIAWGLVPYVALLGLPLVLILLSFRTTAYDDFAFWGPNLVALCESGHFPSLLHPLTTSAMPGYPRAVALVSFATYLFMPNPTPTGLIRVLATGPWWNITLLLGVAAALGAIIQDRFTQAHIQTTSLQRWGLAGLAILLQTFLCPGFIPKMTFSNMGDTSSASGFAILFVLIFELFRHRTTPPPRQIFVNLALVASAVVFIRQDNFYILVILPVIVWLLAKNQSKSWWQSGLVTVLTCLPAMVTHMLWGHYVAHNIIGPSHYLLPFGAWHWGLFYHGTLQSVTKVLLAKGAYSVLAFGFLLALVFVGLGKWSPDQSETQLLVVITVFVFWNALFIMFAYLSTNFSDYDVKTAVTFWRFLAQTGPAETVALACLIPVGYFGYFLGRKICLSLALLAAFVPVALLPTRWSFRNDLHGPVADFLELGTQAAVLLPAHANVLIYDASDGSGFAAWVIKFGLLDLGHTQHHVTLVFAPPPASATILGANGYVFVSTGRQSVAFWRGMMLPAWHLYMFRLSLGQPSLLLARGIAPYR